MLTNVSDIVSPPKGWAAGKHFIEDAAERPDVRALVDRLAARLLGAHVGRRSEDAPVRRAID